VDASTAAVPLEVPLALLGNPLEQEWRTVHFGQSTASICRCCKLYAAQEAIPTQRTCKAHK